MLKTLLLEANRAEPPKEWPTYDGKELDRSEFLSASEVADCLRKTYFNKYSPGEGYRSNGYAERGHAIEQWWAQKLRNTSRTIHFMHPEQVSFYDAELGLSATPDGLLQLPTGEWVMFDFKSIDPRTNKSNLPKKKHIYQVVQGMFLVNSCLPKYNVKRAFLYYIDASDIWDIREHEIAYDSALVQEVIERADKLWTAKTPTDVEAEGIALDDCDLCPHQAKCSAFVDAQRKMEVAKKGSGGFLELQSDDDVDTLQQYVSLYAIQKKTVQDMDALSEVVKKIVKDAGGKLIINDAKVSYGEYPGKTTIDKDAMTAAGLDIEAYQKVGKPYGTLRITPQKRKKA